MKDPCAATIASSGYIQPLQRGSEDEGEGVFLASWCDSNISDLEKKRKKKKSSVGFGAVVDAQIESYLA